MAGEVQVPALALLGGVVVAVVPPPGEVIPVVKLATVDLLGGGVLRVIVGVVQVPVLALLGGVVLSPLSITSI